MAMTTVRKSGRIKTRNKQYNFSNNDDEFETVDFDLDISKNISSILHSHSERKNDVSYEQLNESFPNVARKLQNKEKIDGEDFMIHSDNGDEHILSEKYVESFGYGQLSHLYPSQDHMKAQNSEGQSKSKSGKDFICSHCDKGFTDLAAFKRHLKGHSKERPFKCDLCEKSFIESCSLKRHMKTHEDERPYTCDICFKSFRDSTSFNRHQLTHTERPRSFQCAYCEKNFTDKSGLKRHERTHSGLRPFECTVCHKTFSESGSFRRHQKIHVGIRNHHCPRCKRSFMEKQSLIRHQKTVCGFWKTQDFTALSQENSSISSQEDSVHESSSLPPASVNHIESYSETECSMNILSGKSSATGTTSSISKSKSEAHFQKCSPSLKSLIEKDPKLYDSISDIVDSIDSYEKMLNLCGDSGQKEIEAALTGESSSMPENLMCFECGELLVDGENFISEGKSFYSVKSHNSFKCLNCEEDEENYGEPPVLTVEGNENEKSFSTKDEGTSTSTTHTSTECEDINTSSIHGSKKPKEYSLKQLDPDEAVDILEACSMDMNNIHNSDHTLKKRNAKLGKHIDLRYYDNMLYQENSSNICEKLDFDKTIPCSTPAVNMETHQTSQSSWNNMTALEYEADDPNIPSVFPCHLCTKVFATSSFLEQHLALHRKSPHKCMVCGKTFNGSAPLKRHMHMHTGEKPYSCPSCGKKFRDPSNFGKHKRFCNVIGFVPSPLDSTSSNSETSTASVEANLDDAKRNMANKFFKSGVEELSPSQATAYPGIYSFEQMKEGNTCEESTEPIMAVIPSIDDYEDQDTKVNPGIGEQEQEINYIPCEICQKLCESDQHLEMHMNYHRGNPDVTCIECGKSFFDSHGLKRHMSIHAESRPFICEYCSRGYCDNWSLKKHKSRGCINSELQVPVDFLHPCPRCTRVFCETDLLEEHLKCHKGKLKFECDICLKKFSEAFNLKRHRRLHMTICPGCEGEFKSVSEMNEHQKDCPAPPLAKPAEDSKNDFPCPDCGRTYSTLAYLERHRKVHQDQKLYVCEICNKRFSEAFRLRRHKQVHTEAKPFMCQNCGKGFADEAYLKRHTINSSCTVSKALRGAMSFPCEYCNKVFSKSYMLVRHMNVHSHERPFSCNVCGRSYKDTSSLKRHQLVHQGVKEFICTVCSKAFFYADSLKRHMSGRCGKTKNSKSQKRKTPTVQHRNFIKGGTEDCINNNIYNKRDRTDILEHLSISTNKNKKTNKVVQTTTSEKCHLHTLPYKSRNMSKHTRMTSRGHQYINYSKLGPWSCRKKTHCWQCDTRMPSHEMLLSHIRIHQHKKKFPCLQCFARFSNKMHWKAHLSMCTLFFRIKKTQKNSTCTPPSQENIMKKRSGQRPRRSIPRAQWSWLTQI